MAAAAMASLFGCSDGAPANSNVTPPLAAIDGSFARIQREIFDPSCAACHAAGSGTARQSRLVLSADSSYQQLVGVPSLQQIAKADNVTRVKPFRADSSLLYHKLAWIPGHHSRDYGNLMPMGTTQGVTAGQLEYVRRWIEAGAPRGGHVADTLVLRDNRVQAASFLALSPPAQNGLQLKVDSFAVVPGVERELFVYRQLGNPSELLVTRIESRMRPGSHHLLLHTFDESNTAFPCNTRPVPNSVRDIRNRDGSLNIINLLPMACHVFFGGAMTPEFDYRFPPGVALRLAPNAALDLNVHYVNRSPVELPGEAFANLYTTDRAQVQTIARTLNLGNNDIVLPAGIRTTLTKVFPTNVRTTVLALSSHMHSLGERFEIRVRRANGVESVVYTNTDWEHPAFTNLTTPIVLERGDALVSVITYNNVTSKTVTFGLTSVDEMGIIFGYAY